MLNHFIKHFTNHVDSTNWSILVTRKSFFINSRFLSQIDIADHDFGINVLTNGGRIVTHR